MGAGLLAIAVCQSTVMLNFRSSSRAGSLPQGFFGVSGSGVTGRRSPANAMRARRRTSRLSLSPTG
ncbi:hypothetical protein C1X45_00370 [Pseudomonas sp. GW460-7]|nr:hypothetical protein C1X45_00370 [Pseudomonas sp. GW460-7]PMY00157.1 hypothetical protein C1X43_01625 [Pseudomonas sp. GW460-C3]